MLFLLVSFVLVTLLIYDTVFNNSKSIVSSKLFIFVSIILCLNIFLCSFLKIINRNKLRIHFYLIHFGIIVVILGFMTSSVSRFEADVELKKGEEKDEVEFNGYLYRIPFKIRLNSFEIIYYKNPTLFITINEKRYPCQNGTEIKYNNDLYKIERCFNDFAIDTNGKYINRTSYFNNPAAVLSLNGSERIWLFLNKGSHFNQNLPLTLKLLDADIKDFISDIDIFHLGKRYNFKVSVNKPVLFNGYKIYQMGYDPLEGEHTVLTIKRDKLAWIVFVGFILISGGALLWIFS